MSTRRGTRFCCATDTIELVEPESKDPSSIRAPWPTARSASTRPFSGLVCVSPSSSSSLRPPLDLMPPAALMASAAICAPRRQACPGAAGGPVTGWIGPSLNVLGCARSGSGKPSTAAPAAVDRRNARRLSRIFAIEQPPLGARLYVEIAQPGERSESMDAGPTDPEEESVATSVVTPQRFAKGMTFDQYVRYAGSPENLAREAFGSYVPDGGSLGAPRKDNSAILRERHARARLTEEHTAAIKWLVAQPNGPAKILVISEDWSSDCRRDVPYLARLAEAGGLELRIFTRDRDEMTKDLPDPAQSPNADLMLAYLNEKDGKRF